MKKSLIMLVFFSALNADDVFDKIANKIVGPDITNIQKNSEEIGKVVMSLIEMESKLSQKDKASLSQAIKKLELIQTELGKSASNLITPAKKEKLEKALQAELDKVKSKKVTTQPQAKKVKSPKKSK